MRDPLRVKATYFLLILIHTASVRAHIKVHYLNSLAAFVDELEQSGKLYPSNHRKWIGKFDSEPTVDSYGYRRFDSHSRLDYVGISPFGLYLPNFILHFVALQSLSFG
ncbi:hypothetical protein IX84_15020 [Phaeodactylibacter xiamenensis]|uniref:Uncharacterized protein n=1 Tax=Phaeodactylibacter xiamenensis TaxID=1524460 RepID=A0A098S629_9BACT|nr:hypothetical protein IX84_15020 [Phaeodactylibacter xiamenensis]